MAHNSRGFKRSGSILNKIYKFVILLGVVWFILLCFLHYFSLRELWLDEKSVYDNLKNLSFRQVFGPLKHCQAFPRVYLALIKFISQQFSFHILSLRFLPLICMLLSFFMWFKIYRDRLSLRFNFLLVLFSFASSYQLVYYAAELKQYSMDVLVVGSFCLYLHYQQKFKDKKPTLNFVIFTTILPFFIFLSYAGLFVFWIVIVNFLLNIRKNKDIISLATVYILLSAACLFLAYRIDMRYSLSENCLFDYWRDYFLSTDSIYHFLKSFGEGLQRLVFWPFGNELIVKRIGSLFIPFFISALFMPGLDNKNSGIYTVEALGLIIFLELFLLGILNKYPFTGERITLFFAPFVFFMIVKGISLLKKYRPLYVFFSIFYFAFLILSSFNTLLKYLKFYL